jgi:uncharacterized protein YidB (DUF937 family)
MQKDPMFHLRGPRSRGFSLLLFFCVRNTYMSSIFGDLVGAAVKGALSGGQQANNNPLGSIIGSVLSGGGGQQNSGMLGNVLGAALGGNQGGAGGMLGNMVGAALGGGGAQRGGMSGGGLLAALLPVAMQMMQKSGGLNGMLQKFGQAGLQGSADSWVGTGANQSLTPDQLTKVLGQDELTQVASKLGVPQGQVAGGLAEIFPELINQMTPKGNVPDNHNQMLEMGMSVLQKMMAGR